MSTATTTAPARIEPGFLLLLGALAAMGPASIDLYLPAFGAIATDLHAGPDRVQATLSAYFVGLAAGQLVVGPLSDRLGRRGPMLAGLALYVLASLGCATAGTVGSLTAWRALQAAGACAGLVGSRAVLRDRFPPRDMARALSLVMLVMGIAPIVAPLIGATLHELLGWRALFVLLAAYGATVLAAVGLTLRESLVTPARRSVREVLGGYVQLLGVRPFIAYAVAGSLSQAALFVYVGSSSFVFTGIYGLSGPAYAVLFGVNAAGLIAASQLNERLLRRMALEQLIPATLAVQAAASVAVVAAVASGVGGVAGVAVPLFVAVGSLGFCFPNTTAAAMAPVGDRAGLGAALLGTLQYGTAGVATFLAGRMYDGTAMPMALGMAIASLGSCVALFLLRPGDADGALHGR
ncbi:MAG: multidrug effflux MFS transporter [Alphaproteobacteria bacterium]|nr:multidrug effflux MFS transporter [Alphaproteobacteria bacterium]